MAKIEYSFQTDSPEIANGLLNSNYLIEYNEFNRTGDNFCAIYFSSNDLYYPNRADAYLNQVEKTNRFESYRTRIQTASKHIFVRDITKQWYLNGISHELNSIEKVTAFLKRETQGFKIICMGSSAGGYAAVLFGSFLHAERIYTFNGQFSLYSLLETSTEAINPTLFRELENPTINQYYDITSLILHPERVFYFYSMQSNWDKEQYNLIKDIGLQTIGFKTSHHGIPFLKSNLKFVINLTHKQLKDLVRKSHHPLFFSFKLEGVYKTFYNLGQQIILKRFLKLFTR
ncbi:MAG: hypothetical protein PHV20_14280 [Bacteroidales bacterium]|nr:hypothetical protein [Bacteroidales bacterium]